MSLTHTPVALRPCPRNARNTNPQSIQYGEDLEPREPRDGGEDEEEEGEHGGFNPVEAAAAAAAEGQ